MNMFEIEQFFMSLSVFWLIIKSLWYVWLFAIVVGLLPLVFIYLDKWIEKKRLKKWLEEHKTLEEWKKVEGKKFEKIVAIIFEKLGYKTKIIVDHGIDIVVEKDGKKTFIQCKRMDKVIPDDVRAFWGSIQPIIKKGEKGFLVTTGSFTEGSKEFVKDKPIELIDGLELEKIFKNKEEI